MLEVDLIVIGAGPGGYVGALRAAQLGMRVALIEKQELGGTCLNVGCIPSKTLLYASQQYSWIQKHGESWGICGTVTAQLATMMERKHDVVKGFRAGIQALCQRAKVQLLQGSAELQGGGRIRLSTGEEVQGKWILLATGSEPMTLPTVPVDEVHIVTSTGALALQNVPKTMLVIGAGVIGVELGSVYQRLGAEVTFVEATAGICPGLDGTIAKQFQSILERQGMKFLLQQRVESASVVGGEVVTKLESGQAFKSEVVLLAVGRRPYTQGLGLERVGVMPGRGGKIAVDKRFYTGVDGIYAIGDLIEGPMLAHKASEEAVVCVEGLAGLHPQMQYITIPNVIYTHPEVGAVGLTETQAREAGLEIQTGTFPFKANSRARCCGEAEGLVKLVSEKGTGRLLGMHILGSHASELIAIGVLALQQGMTVKQLGHACLAHPTLSEAIKEAALSVEGVALHQ